MEQSPEGQIRGAFTTLPARRQRVHTRMYCGRPSTIARTRCRLGSHRRLVTLWAWEMLLPVIGPLPQISHRCAMSRSFTVPHRGGGDFYHTAARNARPGTPARPQTVDVHHLNLCVPAASIPCEIAPHFRGLLLEKRALLLAAHGTGNVQAANVSIGARRGTGVGRLVIL